MKTAIYIEKGFTQIVLHAETDFEQSVVDGVKDGLQTVNVRKGSFYHCNGGWVREGTQQDSLIVTIEVKRE